MFDRRDGWKRKQSHKSVQIIINGHKVTAIEGDSLAGAILSSNIEFRRSTLVSDKLRAPYCMMGVCFECLVEVDGLPNKQACLVPVKDGMVVNLKNSKNIEKNESYE